VCVCVYVYIYIYIYIYTHTHTLATICLNDEIRSTSGLYVVVKRKCDIM